MCHFTIPFLGTDDALITKAKQEIENSGGSFEGNSLQGSFTVKTPLGIIEGAYHIIENQITIEVAKKPFHMVLKMSVPLKRRQWYDGLFANIQNTQLPLSLTG